MPDSNGYLLPAEREILLRRYAPVLVLFPEQKGQAPYPDDGDSIYTLRGSYHPRSVNLFLKQAEIRYQRNLVLRNPGLLFKPRSYQEEIEQARESITADELHKGIEEYSHDPRYAGLGDADLRAAILTRLVQRRLADRIRGFDLPYFRGYNLQQWKAYFKLLAESEPETRRCVVYGRLVQGLAPLGEEQAAPESIMAQVSNYGPYDVNQTRIALQYWFQYYYDDWANRHEGDWETITLLLELNPAVIITSRELNEAELLAGTTVLDVGYAAHEDGYRRLWEDVQKTTEGRPIVYVARGSSASYFAWRLEGYPTSARVGVVEKLLAALGSLLRGRRFLGRRWDVEFHARFTGRDPKNTDWVAADPQALDRLDPNSIDLIEKRIPSRCQGVRRMPHFGPEAGHDDGTYHLELNDLFWLEMVQEYGVQWGENSFLPGTKGPSGLSKAQRDALRSAINSLAQIENLIQKALNQLMVAQIVPTSAIPELDECLRPLRPANLERQQCFPESVRPYVYTMWAAILRTHPEAWPGGPGLRLRWIFYKQYKPGPLLERDDPMFHLKTLLAQVRRSRYEIQHQGSKWDNPFAWVRHVCLADTFYYGITPGQSERKLDIDRLDCADIDMSVL